MRQSITESTYLTKRKLKANFLGFLFYIFRLFPVSRRKIVLSNFEGRGYGCNPKYIAEELLRRNTALPLKKRYKLVWLVDDLDKKFPDKIQKVKNNVLNRAYQLSTAAVWVDNVRKPLETRKRPKQLYIATWHGAIGFKPVGKLRGKAFPKIAYLVSEHDSSLVDYFLSNSEWCSQMYHKAFFYEGRLLKSGSPRCDVLVNDKQLQREKIRVKYGLPADSKILIYAPTFRGGSQRASGMDVESEQMNIDFYKLRDVLEQKFNGQWYVFLRLHPNFTKKNKAITSYVNSERLVDVTQADDAYELLAAADAFISDYSSMVFDAAIMKIPVFLYTDDIKEYVQERGELLWDMKELPFKLAVDNAALFYNISNFEYEAYESGLNELYKRVDLLEDGQASARVADLIDNFLAGKV